MSTPSNIITISKLCVAVSHVNRSASVRFEALRVEGREVKVAPNVDDIQARVKSGGIDGLPLSAIIRAFRSQLAVSAPEHDFRKWSLFCSFEGYPEGKGPSRRSVPSFLVSLPTSVTAATPMMTPAATADTTYSGQEAAADEEKPLPTLGRLLEPFFSPATVASYSWHAKLSFVLGEDEEEERDRKSSMGTSMVGSRNVSFGSADNYSPQSGSEPQSDYVHLYYDSGVGYAEVVGYGTPTQSQPSLGFYSSRDRLRKESGQTFEQYMYCDIIS